MDRSHTRSPIGEFGRRAPLVAALIFLVAINLRSPLTTVGPVLAEISADHRLTEALAGLLGALPLLMFAIASRRMAFSMLGFLQYLAPTIVFLLGLFVFDEPLRQVQLACFVLIWTAAAVFVWDLWSRRRR